MNGMCSKQLLTRCDITSSLISGARISGPQLLATAAVARTIRTGPSSTIGVCCCPGSSSSSCVRLPGTCGLPSTALTHELRLCASFGARLRAGRSNLLNRSSCGSRVGHDRALVSKVSCSVGVVESLSSAREGNCHSDYENRGLLVSGHRDRSRQPALALGGLKRRRTRGLPALRYSRSGCVVEGGNSAPASVEKAVGLRGRSASCGNFERMELFKPQLLDTMPFRFMSEYHTAPPRAVKDGISPIFFFGFGQAKPVVEVVQAGDPVLHEPAAEVRPDEIGTTRVEKIINDMVATMRNAPGVGLAAPQIGVNLQIIVLEDTKELMSYCSAEECEVQQRSPFDLLVIINPKLKAKSGAGSAIFFEGCISVEGYRALVERDLEVEVTGLGRDGRPIRVEASGWKARILQHECDHLAGTLYVDKMVPRTFRTKDNLRLPLPAGSPQQGVCKHSAKSLKL